MPVYFSTLKEPRIIKYNISAGGGAPRTLTLKSLPDSFNKDTETINSSQILKTEFKPEAANNNMWDCQFLSLIAGVENQSAINVIYKNPMITVGKENSFEVSERRLIKN